jgi:hypothetical protein
MSDQTSFLPTLPIEGPPCAGCRHWKPQQKVMHTARGFMFDGTRLCHSNEMYSDFSCFDAKNPEQS